MLVLVLVLVPVPGRPWAAGRGRGGGASTEHDKRRAGVAWALITWPPHRKHAWRAAQSVITRDGRSHYHTTSTRPSVPRPEPDTARARRRAPPGARQPSRARRPACLVKNGRRRAQPPASYLLHRSAAPRARLVLYGFASPSFVRPCTALHAAVALPTPFLFSLPAIGGRSASVIIDKPPRSPDDGVRHAPSPGD